MIHHRKIDHCPVVPHRSYKATPKEPHHTSIPIVSDKVTPYDNRQTQYIRDEIQKIKKAILSSTDERNKTLLAMEGCRLNRIYTGIIEVGRINSFSAPLGGSKCKKHKIPMRVYKFTRPNGNVCQYEMCRLCDNERQKNRKKKYK